MNAKTNTKKTEHGRKSSQLVLTEQICFIKIPLDGNDFINVIKDYHLQHGPSWTWCLGLTSLGKLPTLATFLSAVVQSRWQGSTNKRIISIFDGILKINITKMKSKIMKMEKQKLGRLGGKYGELE